MSSSWLLPCSRFAHAAGIPGDDLRLVEAFDPGQTGTYPTYQEEFSVLELEAGVRIPDLPTRIAQALAGEVDPDQAAMFGRRFLAVAGILHRLSGDRPLARILRVALVCRVQEALLTPGPRALRVRALIDFYYSQAAVLHHHPPDGDRLPPPQELITHSAWRRVSPNLELMRIVGQTLRGPLHAHALRARSLRIETRDIREEISVHGDFAGLVQARGAVAGVSGGFFLYSEPDIEPPSRRGDPVGLLLRDGCVCAPPAFSRAALLQDRARHTFIQILGPASLQIETSAGLLIQVQGNNEKSTLNLDRAPLAFNRAFGPMAPDHAGCAVAITGDHVLRAGRGAMAIPLAGFVLTLPTPTLPAGLEPGARIRYHLPQSPWQHPIHEGMSGGPLLLRDGQPTLDLPAEDFAGNAPPITFSRDETRDQNLLPRMAAGIGREGELLLLAVDGRNFHHAPGVTLSDLALMMAALGAEQAMNLDGGSSKRMVCQGRTLDLSTTEVETSSDTRSSQVRPLRSAILLFEE